MAQKSAWEEAQNLVSKIKGGVSRVGQKIGNVAQQAYRADWNPYATGNQSVQGLVQGIKQNPQALNVVSPQAARNNFNAPIGPRGVSLGSAIQQTAPGVAQDFGDMYRKYLGQMGSVGQYAGNFLGTMSQGVGTGVVNAVGGVQKYSQPGITNQLQGMAQTVYGGALAATAPINPLFQGANILSSIPQQVGQNDLLRRIPAGVIGGFSGSDKLTPQVPNRYTNLPFVGDVDVAKAAGGIVGFGMNPVNRKITNLTQGMNLPFIKNPLVNSILKTAIQGGSENSLQQLANIPDKASPEEKAKFMLDNFVVGAGMNLAFGAAGNALGRIGKTKPAQYTKQQLVKAFDELKKWNLPVNTNFYQNGKQVQAPAWRYEIHRRGIYSLDPKVNQKGGIDFGAEVSLPKTGDQKVSTPQSTGKTPSTLKEPTTSSKDIQPQIPPQPKTLPLENSKMDLTNQNGTVPNSIPSEPIIPPTNKSLREKYATSRSGKEITTKSGEGLAADIIDKTSTWKDKPRLSLERETFERNLEDVAGKDAPEMKKLLYEPISHSEAERMRFLNKERSEIKNLGIQPKSKESALVQQYGEGKINEDQLKLQTKNWEKVKTASETLRSKYDTYLTDINKVLESNGYDPIPKRKDYFTHFQEVNNIIERFGIPMKNEALPTDISGLSADFRPGKNFFSNALPRKGDKTAIDAITGIDKYIEGASRQIYHTDNIQRLRLFEKAIREKHADTQHLSNFVANLTEYTNNLAGKKSMIDRSSEALVGRKIYNAANVLKKQVGANAVGANVSSALTNFIPLTQSLATTNKQSFLKGMLQTVSSLSKDDGFVNKSDFLTKRAGSDRLTVGNWEKVGNKAGWMFKTIDNFVSQTIVRGKYDEAIKKGFSPEQAIKQADQWAAKVMADRSVGSTPNLFNSKTLGFLTQFQLEVNNQMSFMLKDIPRAYSKSGAASATAQLFLYSYLFNNLFEKVAGRRPAFDPIGVAQKTYEDYTNKDMKEGQANKNLVRNVSDQLPFSSVLTGGRIPIGGSIPNPLAVVQGESSIKKELLKPVFGLLPPTGGGQIKKGIEGIGAYNSGASKTDSGNVRFPIDQTIQDRVKTAVFGQYSTSEGQKYFREGKSSLGEEQSQEFSQKFSQNPQAAQEYFSKIEETRKLKNDIKKGKEITVENPTIDQKNIIKKQAIESYLSKDKETARSLRDKYGLDVSEKDIESEKKSLVKKSVDLFVSGDVEEAREMRSKYSLEITELDKIKAAKRLAIKKYKSGDKEGARALREKYGFIVTDKDLQ